MKQVTQRRLEGRLRHKRKRQDERRLAAKIGGFLSEAWQNHKEAIEARVKRTERLSHERSLARKRLLQEVK